MFERPQTVKVLTLAVLLLLGLLTESAIAVPVTVYGGKMVQLDQRQVELLKRQPGVYYLKTAPDKWLKHYILVDLPDELGGGFFIAKPADMASALGKVGAIEETEAAGITATAPSNETWFVDLYLGGVVAEDGDVDGKASPFGVTINDSAKADYDNTYTGGGRVGFWSPSTPWIGCALDVSYFKLEADGRDTTYGYGRIDAFAAYGFLQGALRFEVRVDDDGGGSDNFCFIATAAHGSPIEVTFEHLGEFWDRFLRIIRASNQK